jgi:hypothetical protein
MARGFVLLTPRVIAGTCWSFGTSMPSFAAVSAALSMPTSDSSWA